MSVMIGCGIPTAGERVLEMKRLQTLADKERAKTQVKKRKKKYKKSTTAVGPTLVPIVKNNNFSVGAHSGRAHSDKVTVNILKTELKREC
jgi:hypothetical protein